MTRFVCVALLATLSLVGSVAACGGEEDPTDELEGTGEVQVDAGARAPASGAAVPSEVEKEPKEATVSLGSPAEVPRTEGGDTSIQDFGDEASETDRGAVAQVVATYLEAQSSRKGSTACSLLASNLEDHLTVSCEEFFSNQPPLPRAARHATSMNEFLSLRREGERAFAIYRAGDRRVYAIPVTLEADSWKVAAVAGAPID